MVTACSTSRMGTRCQVSATEESCTHRNSEGWERTEDRRTRRAPSATWLRQIAGMFALRWKRIVLQADYVQWNEACLNHTKKATAHPSNTPFIFYMRISPFVLYPTCHPKSETKS